MKNMKQSKNNSLQAKLLNCEELSPKRATYTFSIVQTAFVKRSKLHT